MGNTTGDLQGCFDLSNPITVTRNGVNGGMLTTATGNTALTICAGDGNSDAFDVTLTGEEGMNSGWGDHRSEWRNFGSAGRSAI